MKKTSHCNRKKSLQGLASIEKQRKKIGSSQFLSVTAPSTSDNKAQDYSPIKGLLVCWKNLLLSKTEHQVPSDPQLFSITNHKRNLLIDLKTFYTEINIQSLYQQLSWVKRKSELTIRQLTSSDNSGLIQCLFFLFIYSIYSLI